MTECKTCNDTREVPDFGDDLGSVCGAAFEISGAKKPCPDCLEPPKVKNCEYAKSDMTPCYLRDGESALTGSICIGCSHSVQFLESNKPEQPKCNTCGGDGWLWTNFGKTGKHKTPCPDCPEQPNQELLIIKTIQGLISQINEKITQIPIGSYIGSVKRRDLIRQAVEEIDLFEKTTLFELQKAYES